MTKIINLTPHTITIVGEGNKFALNIEPSGKLARVTAVTETVGTITVKTDVNVLTTSFKVPITTTRYGEVEGLPDPSPDTIYVVSSLVAGRVPDREDVFIPNESVRDEEGRIIGCRSLGHI